MNDTLETKKITANLLNNINITINEENISIINDIFDISNIGMLEVNEENLNKVQNSAKVWTTISNKGIKKQSNKVIKDYKTRTLLIDNIVNLTIKYNIKGINIHFDSISETQAFNRFIIELAPRLREIGVSTNIILTEDLNESDYVGIVDFVIEK